MSRPARAVFGVTAAALALAAGCSATSAKPAPVSHFAAEPAIAPAPSVPPAGRVVRVGDLPEGVSYDQATGTLAVAVRNPDRLLLMAGASMTVRRTVALPGHVRHLQVTRSGGAFLVPCEDANAVLRVDARTGAMTSTATGKSPHDAAELEDGLLVAGDEFGESLTVLDHGAVARTITEVQQPGGVIRLGGSTVGVVDVKAYTLSTFDASTGNRIAILDAGAGPTHGVAVDESTVVVSDTRGGALYLFGTSPLRLLGKIDVGGTPYGLAADQSTRTVWATLTERNEVVGYRVEDSTLIEIARFPTVQQPNTLAVAPGGKSLWIAGTDPGVIELITR